MREDLILCLVDLTSPLRELRDPLKYNSDWRMRNNQLDR